MLTKPGKLPVDPTDPFKHDQLGRVEVGRQLTALCTNAVTPYVIAVDGAWGTGKTTFLEMWQRKLELEGFITLTFNAWEADYVEDPIIAFVGEVQSAIDARRIDLSKRPRAASAWERAKTLGVGLAKVTGPLLLRAATTGLLDSELLKGIKDAIGGDSGEVGDQLKEYAETKIAEYAAGKRTLGGVRKLLSEFASELSKTDESDAPARKPIVFLIDELDRCRPTFAIEFLERLKHVFGVEGFIFVIAIDRGALCESIKAVYGDHFDSPDYLRRFIDFRVELPLPDYDKFISWRYAAMDFQRVFDNRSGSETPNLLMEYLKQFTKSYRMSLRTVDQLMSELYAMLAMTPKRFKLLSYDVAALVALRHAEPELYRRFMIGSATAEEVCTRLESRSLKQNFFSERSGEILRASLFHWSQVEGELKNEIQRLSSLANNTLADTGDVSTAAAAKSQLNVYEHLQGRDHRDLAPYIRRRLQLLESFS